MRLSSVPVLLVATGIVTSMFCLGSPPAVADVIPFPTSGGIPMSNTTKGPAKLEILDETVKLTVSPGRCLVDQVFKLKNTGATSQAELGFPYWHTNEFMNFTASINGTKASVQDEERNLPGRPPDHPKMVKWKIWNMNIPVGEERTVRVQYATIPGGTFNVADEHHSGYFSEMPHPAITTATSWYNEPEASLLNSASPSLRVSYALWSGGWKGKVRHCHVEIDCQSLAEWTCKATPDGFKKTNNIYLWEMNDIASSPNIDLNFSHAVNKQQQAYAFKQIALNHSNDFDYCCQTAEALLALGYEDLAREVQKKSLESWKKSDAKIDEFYWGQVQPKWYGALFMADSLLKYYDTKHDVANAAIIAKIALNIYNADLALLPKDKPHFDFTKDYNYGPLLQLSHKYARASATTGKATVGSKP